MSEIYIYTDILRQRLNKKKLDAQMVVNVNFRGGFLHHTKKETLQDKALMEQNEIYLTFHVWTSGTFLNT